MKTYQEIIEEMRSNSTTLPPEQAQQLNQQLHNQIIEQAKSASTMLPSGQVQQLKQRLQEYMHTNYSQSTIFSSQNITQISFALDWSIKRTEQILNTRQSETGNLVIGDGSWLATPENYFNTLTTGLKDPETESVITIKNLCEEYLQVIGLDSSINQVSNHTKN